MWIRVAAAECDGFAAALICLLARRNTLPLRACLPALKPWRVTVKIVLNEFESAMVPIHIKRREGRYAATNIRRFIHSMTWRLRANTSLN